MAWEWAAAALPGVGQGIASYLGQKETNEANAAEAAANRQFQSNMFTSATDYNTAMSNTSFQRGRRDMEAAGLNPIMMMNQGGASTPTASAPSGGVGNAQQNPMMGLSQGIQNAVTSAMSAMNTIANVKNVEADTGLKALQGVTEKAKAERETWNARESMENVDLKTQQRKSWEYGRKAEQEEGKYRADKATLERANLALDKMLEQVGQGSGIVRDAASSVGDILYPWRLMKQDRYRHEDKMLKGYKTK